MGFYQRLKQSSNIIATFLLILFLNTACKQQSNNYFKVTISDEPQPQNILPEFIEVSSEGKLVILTNRFNENADLYQSHHFVELNKQQIDSLHELINKAIDVFVIPDTGNDTLYKLNFEETNNGKRHNQFIWITQNYTDYLEFIKRCQKIPLYSKRFTMDGSYYFNTSEVCEIKE